MTKVVLCIARSEPQAQLLTRVLRQSGTSSHDISLLLLERSGTHYAIQDPRTTISDGAVTGTGKHQAIGGALAWMLDIATLTDPDGAGYIAAGPILALLAGKSVGSQGGSIAAALVVLGLSGIQAEHYTDQVRSGRFLILVHTDSQSEIDTATQLFRDGEAADILSIEAAPLPHAGSDRLSSPAGDQRTSTTARLGAIPDAALGIHDAASSRSV